MESLLFEGRVDISSPPTSMPTSALFISDHKLAHLSVCREESFGHGRLRIVDARRALWTWHRNDDVDATISDQVWLESLADLKG
ncbi:purple acid phosphatase 22-like [Panicum miliaceum]|uniref:Purple acid phosphatase 22-like n=1 Tax=Panicum miliaceum TaxID=4540 RepID=A0A3L6PK01_PANMI|nr:purple acid phosphatase 22-like [Panicum miliaceum]